MGESLKETDSGYFCTHVFYLLDFDMIDMVLFEENY